MYLFRPLQMTLYSFSSTPISKNASRWAVYYVFTKNFTEWLMNLIKFSHAHVNLQAWFALLQATTLVWPQAAHC